MQGRLNSLCHILLVATEGSQDVFYFEEVRGSRGTMRGRVDLNQGATLLWKPTGVRVRLAYLAMSRQAVIPPAYAISG